jgi:hypothetical protein
VLDLFKDGRGVATVCLWVAFFMSLLNVYLAINWLPHVVLGSGNGAIRGGRHVAAPEGTPMADLLLTVAQRVGVEQDRFGISRGTIEL